MAKSNFPWNIYNYRSGYRSRYMKEQIGFQPIKSCVNIGETLYINIDIMLSTHISCTRYSAHFVGTEIKLTQNCKIQYEKRQSLLPRDNIVNNICSLALKKIQHIL